LHNVKLHETFLTDIIQHKPDFIIGDFNIVPVQKQLLNILCNAGYKTESNDESTSIHDVKIDWAWYKPELNGKIIVYDLHLSDHRPIGFTFNKWDALNKWSDNITQNGNDWNGNDAMSYDNVENIGPNKYTWYISSNNSSNNTSNNSISGGNEHTSIFINVIVLLILALILYLLDSIFRFIFNLDDTCCEKYQNVNIKEENNDEYSNNQLFLV
jgi:hypothetical protein